MSTIRQETAALIGCTEEELDSHDALVWLTKRVYEGRGPVMLCMTDNGEVGVFESLDESAKALGVGYTAEEAIGNASRRRPSEGRTDK